MRTEQASPALVEPSRLHEAVAVFVSLGATAWLGGALVASGQLTLAGAALVAMLGSLVGLKRVDAGDSGLEEVTG